MSEFENSLSADGELLNLAEELQSENEQLRERLGKLTAEKNQLARELQSSEQNVRMLSAKLETLSGADEQLRSAQHEKQQAEALKSEAEEQTRRASRSIEDARSDAARKVAEGERAAQRQAATARARVYLAMLPTTIFALILTVLWLIEHAGAVATFTEWTSARRAQITNAIANLTSGNGERIAHGIFTLVLLAAALAGMVWLVVYLARQWRSGGEMTVLLLLTLAVSALLVLITLSQRISLPLHWFTLWLILIGAATAVTAWWRSGNPRY